VPATTVTASPVGPQESSATSSWLGVVTSQPGAAPSGSGNATWTGAVSSEPGSESTATSTWAGFVTSSLPACPGVSTPVQYITVTDTVVQTVTGSPASSSTLATVATYERKRRAGGYTW